MEWTLVIWLTVGLLPLIAITRAGHKTGSDQEEDEDKCSSQAMLLSMSACQASRHKLSLASQTNDTVKLCGALQRYSNCMAPRLEGCKGSAKMAFDVIRTKYATHYNCHIVYASLAPSRDGQQSAIDSHTNQGQGHPLGSGNQDSSKVAHHNNETGHLTNQTNQTSATDTTSPHPAEVDDGSLSHSFPKEDLNLTKTTRLPIFNPANRGITSSMGFSNLLSIFALVAHYIYLHFIT